MAGLAADPSADLSVVRNASPMIHAALAVLVLTVATVLAVYKPSGMTRYGWRKQHEKGMVPRQIPPQGTPTHGEGDVSRPERQLVTGPPWRRYVLIGIIGLVLLLVLLHLMEGGIPQPLRSLHRPLLHDVKFR